MTDETAKQAQQTVLSERLAVLKKNKAFIVGVSILGFWVFSAIFGKLIARYDQDFMDYEYINSAPSGKYWFGTDSNGRDVYSRVIVGSRIIIVISFLATLLGAFLGASLGLAAGYLKGKFDMVLMRILEAISAIPVIIIALLAVAAIGRSSSIITILIIGFIFTPNVARTVRAAVLGESELEYVAAAKLRTEKTAHILFREVLPNVLPTLIVEFTVRLGYAIFAVATLEAGSPDWGTQVADTWSLIFTNVWWPTLFPSLAIASVAVSINLISDALLEVFEL
jgi:peptide/nickel transport system permease protein